jgi:hypothetical protein
MGPTEEENKRNLKRNDFITRKFAEKGAHFFLYMSPEQVDDLMDEEEEEAQEQRKTQPLIMGKNKSKVWEERFEFYPFCSCCKVWKKSQEIDVKWDCKHTLCVECIPYWDGRHDAICPYCGEGGETAGNSQSD